jgi:hypothetical protein
LEAFLLSTGIVALAEIGDKTQLLAFVLAAKFRKPVPIVLGILVATIANHAGAGALGAWISTLVSPEIMRWALGISFLAMAAWIMVPDKLDDDDTDLAHFGVFMTTLLAFFMAETHKKGHPQVAFSLRHSITPSSQNECAHPPGNRCNQRTGRNGQHPRPHDTAGHAPAHGRETVGGAHTDNRAR